MLTTKRLVDTSVGVDERMVSIRFMGRIISALLDKEGLS